jgi:hypothetical protein
LAQELGITNDNKLYKLSVTQLIDDMPGFSDDRQAMRDALAQFGFHWLDILHHTPREGRMVEVFLGLQNFQTLISRR